MSAELMLAVAVLCLFSAGAVVVAGIARVNARIVAAGGAAAGLLWIGCGWLIDEEPDSIYRVVALRVRAVDAASGEVLPNVVAGAVAPSKANEATVYRLPSSLEPSGAASTTAVSVIAEWQIDGSLVDHIRNADPHAKLVDQTLEFESPGYRPIQRKLSELLPAGWPRNAQSAVEITIEFDRNESPEGVRRQASGVRRQASGNEITIELNRSESVVLCHSMDGGWGRAAL